MDAKPFGVFLSISLSLLISMGALAGMKDVDLRPLMSPIRDQGEIGWCYAYVAADLLSFKFREELKGEGVSAISVALDYNEQYANGNLQAEIGKTHYALDAVMGEKGHGLCAQSDDLRFMKTEYGKPFKDYLGFIRALKEIYDKNSTSSSAYEALSVVSGKEGVTSQISKEDFYKVFNTSTPENVLRNIFDNSCVGSKIKFKKPIQVKNYLRHNKLVRAAYLVGHSINARIPENRLLTILNKQLDQGNIVGIMYYSGFLDLIGAKAKEEDAHASVIVGRRWSEAQQQTEYILRNSWGPLCDYPWACEGGYVFVGEDMLDEFMFRVTYITKD